MFDDDILTKKTGLLTRKIIKIELTNFVVKNLNCNLALKLLFKIKAARTIHGDF